MSGISGGGEEIQIFDTKISILATALCHNVATGTCFYHLQRYENETSTA